MYKSVSEYIVSRYIILVINDIYIFASKTNNRMNLIYC